MDPVVKLAASALPGERKYILFAGAGVSKDASIPTSWDLMLKTAVLLYAVDNPGENAEVDIEKWFLNSRYAQMTYSELIGSIYPHNTDQQQFLSSYLEGHEIGQSHRGIAELVRRGIVRAIITTNFDHYIEKALEEYGLDIQVISNDEDLNNSEPLIHCRVVRIYKPHGTLGKGRLKNTPKDLESLSPLMEQELIRVMSEHGVIVLGYAGQDPGIIKIFQDRKSNFYPFFWINPSKPSGDIESIFNNELNTFIQCVGASQFIKDFLKLQDRIKLLTPSFRRGPTIVDLRLALANKSEPSGPLFTEYLDNIFNELQKSQPDFKKFDEIDDAILDQINNGITISYAFIEAAILANKYEDFTLIKLIYEYFGRFLSLYDIPDEFEGSYRDEDFDGNRFLVYEMFLGFIASILKLQNWDILFEILGSELFVDKSRYGGYKPFTRINAYIRSLDQYRNRRLNLDRYSVASDLLKDRFEKGQLNDLLSFKEIMEADYFLFMRTVCHDDESLYLTWRPAVCIYLNNPPNFIVRSEKKQYLQKVANAAGFVNPDDFLKMFRDKHRWITNYYKNTMKDDPLHFFDMEKLGTLN